MERRGPLTLGVVDNDPLVAESLRRLLEGQGAPIQVLWTAYSAREAESLCNAELPHMMLTDVEMPERDGIALATSLAQRFPDLAVVAMTAFEMSYDERELDAAGVAAVINKDATPLEFLNVIAQTSGNGRLLEWLHRMSKTAKPTAQELAALRLLANGETTQSAARMMHVSETTVKTYIRRLFAKLGVSSRAQAVLVCATRGLL